MVDLRVRSGVMAAIGYEFIRKLSLIQHYEASFRKATGLSLKLIPANGAVDGTEKSCRQNPFCGLVFDTPGGHEVCRKMTQSVQQRAFKTGAPHRVHCFAGMTVVGIPLIIDRHHVATLLSGRVFLRKPQAKDFRLVGRQLERWGFSGSVSAVKDNFYLTPVVDPDQFTAMVRLLEIFADQLAAEASRAVLAVGQDDPPAVQQAKRFFTENLKEGVTLQQVAQKVGFSPTYFCRVFRKATGMTFTEYATRVRVERAKELLHNPFLRISEVAFESGFGSIPHFNSIFRAAVGSSPTTYRKSLPQRFAI